VVAGAVAAALRARGERVVAFKPVVTGVDEPAGDWPHDDAVLLAAAGEAVVPHRYGPAVSPHLAAELAGETLTIAALATAAREAARGATLVAEGVGGLLVPLAADGSVRDLAVDLGLPLLIAARPGLGTINHTLLTLEAARAAGLAVAAVVLTPWAETPSVMERSNRETIERLGGVRVATLAPTTPATLAQAGAALLAGLPGVLDE
jgi:dethiobiotin synthetase